MKRSHRKAVAAVFVLTSISFAVSAATAPPVASERHARCGLNKELGAAQIGVQEVNSEIILTEPPMRDLRKLSCYDSIRQQFGQLKIGSSIPGFILSFISSFACDAITDSMNDVRDRYRDFSTTPYGQALAASGAELPVTYTPPTFLSQPEPAAPTVNSPVFGTAPSESPDRPTTPAPQGLPQGGGPNIY